MSLFARELTEINNRIFLNQTRTLRIASHYQTGKIPTSQIMYTKGVTIELK